MKNFSSQLPQNPVSAYFLTISPSSKQSYFYRLREFCLTTFRVSDFDQCNWPELSYLHILHYIAVKRETETSLDSINVTLAIVKSVALHAWQMSFINVENYMKIKAIKRLKSDRLPSGRCLELYEIKAIKVYLAKRSGMLAKRNRAIFRLAIGAGLRRLEILQLQLEDIDLESNTFIVNGKGNKQRLMPLDEQIEKTLLDWIKSAKIESGHIFINHKTGKRLSLPTINNIFVSIWERTECKPFTTHDLRRTFASYLLDEDADMFTVQSLLGHTSINTTKRYDKRGQKIKTDTMKLLPY